MNCMVLTNKQRVRAIRWAMFLIKTDEGLHARNQGLCTYLADAVERDSEKTIRLCEVTDLFPIFISIAEQYGGDCIGGGFWWCRKDYKTRKKVLREMLRYYRRQAFYDWFVGIWRTM